MSNKVVFYVEDGSQVQVAEALGLEAAAAAFYSHGVGYGGVNGAPYWEVRIGGNRITIWLLPQNASPFVDYRRVLDGACIVATVCPRFLDRTCARVQILYTRWMR